MSDVNWEDVARKDLEFLRKHIEDNHPGPVDRENPDFLQWLSDGYAACEKQLGSVKTERDHRLLINSFIAGFRDTHLRLEFYSNNLAWLWPGFIVGGRNGKVHIIANPRSDFPPVGAEVISCDGIAVDQLLKERVFRFTGNPNLSASFDRDASQLFFHAQNSFFPDPFQTCELRIGERVFELKLDWQAATADTLNLLYLTAGGTTAKPSLEKKEDGVFWLKLPSFLPQQQNLDNLASLFRDINRCQAEIARAPALVVDLRCQSGGSSVFGLYLVNLLFDKETIQAAGYPKTPTSVDWRASKYNIEVFEGYLNPSDGVDATFDENVVQYLRRIIDGLRETMDGRDDFYHESPNATDEKPSLFIAPETLPYWRQPGGVDQHHLPRFVQPVPVKAKIYVLMGGSCVSACLDCLDYLHQFESITYIGLPTNADTEYMEESHTALPSGVGIVASAMKVYRNRARKAGEVYTPDIPYEGIDRSDEVVTRWALDLVRSEIQ